MRTRRPNLLLTLPVVAVAALAACGDDGNDREGDAAGIATLPPTALATSTTVATDDDTAVDAPAPAPDTGDSVATPGSDTDSPSSDPQQAMLDYAACMRDNGIDMPDPQFSGDGAMTMTMGAGPGDDGPSAEEFEAAEEECQPLMEAARSEIDIDPEEQAEMQERMLEFAQCMRDQGIDMPDPQFDENGGITMQVGEPGDAGPPSDEEFASASEVCGQEGGMAPALAVGESG